MVALVDSSPLLRSTFFSPSSSFRPVKNSRFPRRHRHSLFRKCISQMPSAFPSGVGTDLHDSIVQLQVGLLQTAVDVGLPLPANNGALNWLAFAVPAVWWYVAAAPGSLSGLVDFTYAPVHSFSNISFDAEEVQVGRQIGEGSFGIVYEGYIGRGVRKGAQKKELHVILKKVRPQSKGASEMHDAEVHMNRRVQRTAPNACADFLGTTEVSSSQARGRLTEGLWLVWRYQGDRTLAYYMKQKKFPENVAEFVLGSKAKGTSKQEMAEQNSAVIREITTQILNNLRDLHKTGLVHRDVKPLNLILAQDSGTFKLVDLGAAVDIRSGFNYVPDETIIDPTYAAPEHHVMPTSTPQLPPDPLCSVVSPLVWLMNTPDRFDLYSAGLVLLQMAVKPLRQDMTLQQFNSEFKRVGYDLDAWRKRCRFVDEEFALLDADGGAGWELVRSMLLPRHDRASVIWPSLGSSRPSAEAALRHRFLTGSFVKLPSYKFPKLPAITVSLQPSNLIPNLSFPNLSIPNLDIPKLSPPNISFPKFSIPSVSTPKFSIPSVSIPKFSMPSVSAPKFSMPSVRTPKFSMPSVSTPKFSMPSVSTPKFSMPSASTPNFSMGSFSKLGVGGSGMSINWQQVNTTMSTILPTAITSGLTLTAGWLVFSALKDSAQKSYEVGQSLATAGPAFLISFVLVRFWVEAQEKKQSSNSVEPNFGSLQMPSSAAIDNQNFVEERAIDDLPRSHLHHVRESFTLTGADESEESNQHVGLLAAADVETLHQGTITKLLSSRPQLGTRKYSTTGLVEAVQTMELQLASLETSIAAERLFSQQQQQQIIQMEKLLTQRPQETVTAAKQSAE